MKADHKVRAKEQRGFVPQRFHYPVCKGPATFGYLSRTYAKDANLVYTRNVGNNVRLEA